MLDHPGHELGPGDAGPLGLLRRERERRHTGLGVQLQDDEPRGTRLAVVPAEVGTGEPAAAEFLVRRERPLLGGLIDIFGNRRRHEMLGDAVGVLGFVVVEAGARPEFGDGDRLVAHHGDREFATRHELLDQHALAERGLRCLDGGEIVAVAHDVDPDARALVDRLHDIGARHGIAGSKRATLDHPAFGNAQAK